MWSSIAHLAKKNKITKGQFASLRKAIKHIKKSLTLGLDLVKLDMRPMPVVVLSDASFANVPGIKCQLGTSY